MGELLGVGDVPGALKRVRPRALALALGGVAALAAAAGTFLFVRYARQAAPDPRRVAVAPFDVDVPGEELARWRVALADAVTRRLAAGGMLDAVPQAVVAERWRGQERAEIAAVELARRTGAGVALYGRIDSLRGDSVRLQALLVDATSTRVRFGILLRLPAGDLDAAADMVAGHVTHLLARP